MKPVLIAGPTASGKSSAALAIADACGGVIINADSAQVYKELSILTARPQKSELARAPHFLYGHVSGREAYSTGAWLRDVGKLLKDTAARGERAIIVGGTGLYFHGLLEGLSCVPAIDEDTRAHWRGEAERLGGAGLHKVLLEKDPVMAGILNPNDRQRLVRALEVLEGTGRSLRLWQAETGPPLLKLTETHPFVLNTERPLLYERINQRFEKMVEGGVINEVKAVVEAGFSAQLPMMRALGVPELCQYIKGDISLDEAISRASQQTRRYAKRQLTWLRRNMIAWNQVNTKQMKSELANIFAIIHNNG